MGAVFGRKPPNFSNSVQLFEAINMHYPSRTSCENNNIGQKIVIGADTTVIGQENLGPASNDNRIWTVTVNGLKSSIIVYCHILIADHNRTVQT